MDRARGSFHGGGRSPRERTYAPLVGLPRPFCAVVLALALVPCAGCATAIASALGATGSSATAATEVDRAMLQAALDGMSSGGATGTRPAPAASSASFGGEPAYLCRVPGEEEAQRLAASSRDGAIATCAAMNELPEGGACACDETEEGSSLGDPLAER